uniref:Protein ZBED8 n=1 Tax=Cacopsylla melanoneura TaxID=428564 RepID=A0A8D8RKV1_9HEMI
MKNNSFSKDKFLQKSLIEFWCSVRETYPNLANMALKILVPFVSTYLCEAGFSTLVNIKTKSRNRLDVRHDMRLALSKTASRIVELVASSGIPLEIAYESKEFIPLFV